MRGCFVTATDTGVGKTVVAAAICCALRASGETVAAAKPVVTGLDEPEPGVPPDHVLLASCTGQQPEDVTAQTFGPAVSPHLAAQLAGVTLDVGTLVDAARGAWRDVGGEDAILVVEGVGGLLVPLAAGLNVRDYAVALGLPVVIAARPGLGTINHTLLTIESARGAGLHVRAVVLTPWPEAPSVMERSNATTIEELGGTPVAFLPQASALGPEALTTAAAGLDVPAWIGLAQAG